MYMELGMTMADQLLRLLAEELGGERITIPSLEVLHREGRNACIRTDYDTGQYSQNELAVKYDTDSRNIARILKKEELFGKEGA